MSYSVQAYAVSIDKVNKCVGSRSARQLRKLKRKFGSELAAIDEIDDETISVEQALSDLVMGEPPAGGSAFRYGCGFEFLCRRFGKQLTNRSWSAMRWDWVEEVDALLAELGVAEDVFSVGGQLLTRGAPIPLPPIDDFPSIGYLLEAEIGQLLVKFGEVGEFDDDDAGNSITEMLGWFETCVRSHQDLVCVYS